MIALGDVVGVRVKGQHIDEDAVGSVGTLKKTDHHVAEELPVASVVTTVTKMHDFWSLHVYAPSLNKSRGSVEERAERK